MGSPVNVIRNGWRGTLLLFAVSTGVNVAAQERDAPVTITLLKVWASQEKKPRPFPKELSKYEKLLKKRTKKKRFNAFRLQDKPTTRKVSRGQKVPFPLPEKFTLTLIPKKDKRGKKTGCCLEFHLANKDSKKPFKARAIISAETSVILTPIKNGREQLLMILTYQPAAKKGTPKKSPKKKGES